MRVVVEVLNGPRAGHKVLLGDRQSLVFGNTEWADVVFRHDKRMAARHFLLEAHAGLLQIRDLASPTGTIVNRLPVRHGSLGDGDIVEAGETRLAVRVNGTAELPVTRESDAPPIGAAVPVATAAAPSPAVPLAPGTVTYRRTECRSGLTRLEGQAFGAPAQFTASALASTLAELIPLTVVVHARRLGLDSLPCAVPLFDWLPDESRSCSPQILPPAAGAARTSAIDAGWDRDAVLCYFSRLPADELIRHLRATVRYRIDDPCPTDDDAESASAKLDSPSILGVCWPTVTSSLLCQGEPPLARRLLQGIDAALMELPGHAGAWQLVGRPDILDVIQSAGFVEVRDAA